MALKKSETKSSTLLKDKAKSKESSHVLLSQEKISLMKLSDSAYPSKIASKMDFTKRQVWSFSTEMFNQSLNIFSLNTWALIQPTEWHLLRSLTTLISSETKALSPALRLLSPKSDLTPRTFLTNALQCPFATANSSSKNGTAIRSLRNPHTMRTSPRCLLVTSI